MPTTLPPVWKRPVFANVLLLALFLSELSLIWLAHKTSLQGVVEALTPIAVVGGVVLGVAKYVLKLFEAEAKPWQRQTLQSRQATRVLGALVLLPSYFAVASFLMILWPGPLVCILPGRNVFNRLTGAVPGHGVSYELRVMRGDTQLAKDDVTGAGSIYLGANPRKRIGRITEEALLEELDRSIGDYLAPDSGPNDFSSVWRDSDPEHRRFIRARLPKRERIVVELLCAENQKVLTTKTVYIDGRASVQVQFLEAEKSAQLGCFP
jgi:hypothetical protein